MDVPEKAEAQGYAYRWLGALEDVEGVEVPPEFLEASHTRSSHGRAMPPRRLPTRSGR